MMFLYPLWLTELASLIMRQAEKRKDVSWIGRKVSMSSESPCFVLSLMFKDDEVILGAAVDNI